MVDQSLRDKTCLITGTARGMGRIAARELARLGARIILIDIKGEEGREARDEIIELTGNDQLEFVYCDVSSFKQVGCKLLRPFFNDPERSVKTYVYLAASPILEKESGKYWEHLATKESSPASCDRSEMKRLWDWSERAVGLDPWPEGAP